MPQRTPPSLARLGPLLAMAIALASVVSLALTGEGRAAQNGDSARVRIVHGVADAGALDVYVDSALALIGIVFGETSAELDLSGGKHEFAVAPSGSTPEAAIAAGTVTFDAGAAYLTPLLGTVESTSVGLFKIDEQSLPQGRARFRVINGVADAGELVPVFTGGDALSEPLGFGDVSAYAGVDAGTYDLDILDEASGVSLLALPQTPFLEGATTDIVLIGQIGDGSVRALIETTPVAVERETGLAVQIVAGTCRRLQEPILDLGVVQPGQGDAVGVGNPPPVSQGYTLAAVPFATLVASPHALVVSNGSLSTQDLVACGEIAGRLTETGSLAIGLQDLRGGNANGAAVFAPGVEDPDTTGVSVFLTGPVPIARDGTPVATG